MAHTTNSAQNTFHCQGTPPSMFCDACTASKCLAGGDIRIKCLPHSRPPFFTAQSAKTNAKISHRVQNDTRHTNADDLRRQRTFMRTLAHLHLARSWISKCTIVASDASGHVLPCCPKWGRAIAYLSIATAHTILRCTLCGCGQKEDCMSKVRDLPGPVVTMPVR